MDDIELILGLLLVVAVLVTVARRIELPYPIVLVLGGLLLALVPGLPALELDPDVVFLLFLPPLVYLAAVFTSLREFRAKLRLILLLAVGLVLWTTGAVALVAHVVIPNMTWAVAFVLGAIVAPPDAVAATAIVRRLGVPRRLVTLLEGESLLNDATALIAYRFAVAAVVTGSFSPSRALVTFFGAAAGGVLIGLAAGWVATEVRRRLNDPPVEIIISLLTPFAAYLPAEQLGASGVVAAVTCGLYLGWFLPEIASAEQRLQGQAVWQMLEFLLNGVIFMLIGLQLRGVVAELNLPPLTLVWYAVAISLAAILARLAWVFPAVYLPYVFSSTIRRSSSPPSWPHVGIVAWTGMRGVVSLAAALALPFTTADGSPFPERHLVIFLTFSVILVTLVLQGLSLPLLIRWLGLAEDGSEEHEEAHARIAASEAALVRLDALQEEWPAHRELIDDLRAHYDHRTRHVGAHHDSENGAVDQELVEHRLIRQAVIRSEREVVEQLRRSGEINDDVMRRIQRDLDLEEARMEA